MIANGGDRVFSILCPHHTISQISLPDKPGERFHSSPGPALGGGA